MKEQIKETIQRLKKGQVILYPTETVWGIGCDATNFDAIAKIYAIKQREETKSMICLVSDIKMLQFYVENVPEAAYNILKFANKPTTIIYDQPKNVAENVVAEDNTVGIRIIKQGFAHQLIKAYGKPIVSTSANISGQPTPKSFNEISQDILTAVDYVVNLPKQKSSGQPSAIIKLSNDGMVKVIRS